MFDRAELQVRRDMQYLAGNLPHRGAYTDSERIAAEYVRDRFLEHTPDVEVDPFTSIESYYYLFASYYAEFLFVAIAAIWFPWLAFAYGLLVFVAYLAEFTTYRVAARLLPQYESQNVVARFLAPQPSSLFVITAHYDSHREGPLNAPALRQRLRGAHLSLILCMMVVLATCAAQGFEVFTGAEFRPDLVARWSAVGCLLAAAVVLFYQEAAGEFSSGAVDNASGVALLLTLAERLRQAPLSEEADVWLVATGAHDAWMSGMRHFVKSHRFDRGNTYFLHIDNVGAPRLRYVTGEGLLHTFRSAPEMLDAARRVAAEHGAESLCDRGLPSDALVTLVRGYKALRITALEPEPTGDNLSPRPDGLARVDYRAILRAASFAEATLRGLAAMVARPAEEPQPRALRD